MSVDIERFGQNSPGKGDSSHEPPPASGGAFSDLPVPENLQPFFRRALAVELQDGHRPRFRVAATGYNYLGWVWRGRWNGSIKDTTIFDTDTHGPLFVSGQIEKSAIFGQFYGCVCAVFFEFQPFGLFRLFGIQGEDLKEKAIQPELLGVGCSDFVDELKRVDLSSFDNRQAYLCLVDALDALALRARSLDRRLIEAAAWLEAPPGGINVSKLADEIGLSERSLRRKFASLDGISPKRFGRVVQTNTAFAAVLEGGRSLSEIANVNGFSDQSHMIRSFNEFLFMSPKRFKSDFEETFRRFVGMSQSRNKNE